MAKQNGKSATEELKWVTERKTALSILMLLAKLGKASRYDLANKLDVSYATVMQYIRKFKKAGIVREIGEVEAERGGKKTLYEPTKEAMDLLSEVESPEKGTLEMQLAGYSRPSPSSLNVLYSLTKGKPERDRRKEMDKVKDILKDMRVDVAVVVNYKGHPIPIMPISTLGRIEQASAILSDNVSKKILTIAMQVAEKIAEEDKS